MFDLGKILIYKAVMHTINKDSEMPNFSSYEIDHDEELVFKLLELNLAKIQTSKNMKWANFKKNSHVESILEELDADLDLFMETTKQISCMVQKRVSENKESLTSCDLAFVLFEMDEIMYFACIKFNYKDLLVRVAEDTASGSIFVIKKSNDLYMGLKSNPMEAFIVHLKHMDIALVDKQYAIKGEKINFFGELILNLKYGYSEVEKFKNFSIVNKRIQDKFIGESIERRAMIKKSISDNIVENGSLDVEQFVDDAFGGEQEIKGFYEEAFKKCGLEKAEIKLDERNVRKFDKQKISTSCGAEINMPVDYYTDKEKFEVICNADGTVSLVIKNIEEFKII